MTLKYLCLLTILSYLYIAFSQGAHLLGRRSPWPRSRYLVFSSFSLAGHGWILYKLIETPQGQNLDWLIMLSCTLWLMNILTVIASARTTVENTSVLTYPLAAISVGLALVLGGSEVVHTNQPHMLAHIFLSLLAMSVLALASLQAILMGLQNYSLKRHYAAPMLNILPPLETMERRLFQIIWGGTLLLTASLGSGFFFPHAWQATQFPKMVRNKW